MKKDLGGFCAYVRPADVRGTAGLYNLGVEIDVAVSRGQGYSALPSVYGETVRELFTAALSGVSFDAIELSGFSGDELAEAAQYIKDVRYLALSDCDGVTDISFIEQLSELRALDIRGISALGALPRLSLLPHLKSLHLVRFEELSDYTGLAESGIERLVLKDGCYSHSFLSRPTVDVEALAKMPCLKVLELDCGLPEDSSSTLLTFSRLTGLESISVPSDAFTLAQFAWLSAKLPGVKGLEPIRDSNVWIDSPAVRCVIGKENPQCNGDASLISRYESAFNALKEEYGTRDNPPDDKEKVI